MRVTGFRSRALLLRNPRISPRGETFQGMKTVPEGSCEMTPDKRIYDKRESAFRRGFGAVRPAGMLGSVILGVLSVALALLAMSVSLGEPVPPAVEASSLRGSVVGVGATFDVARTIEPRFAELAEKWQREGLEPASGVEVAIPVQSFRASPEGIFEVRHGYEGEAGPALLWKNESGWLEWSFEVPRTGLYWIGLKYLPLQGRSTPGRPVERGLMIDGTYPFNEARRLVLHREFKDAGGKAFYNTGDEKRPRQLEVRRWRDFDLEDADAAVPGPLLFPLTAGKHTLRLVGRFEPVAIAGIRVKSPEVPPSYREYVERYRNIPGYAGDDIVFQAEDTHGKSLPSLRREESSNPVVSPFDPRVRRLNVFGGWRWRLGRQWAEWRFVVPKDGLYKIGMSVLQNNSNQLASYRKIEIDGRVPFREFERYTFPYRANWHLEALSDEGDRPFLVYFSKGEHRITMTPVMGPLEPVLRSLYSMIVDMASLYRRIVIVTGTDPDLNFEYELEKQIPQLVPELERMSRELEMQSDFIARNLGKRGSIGNLLLSISTQLADMARNPYTIPARLNVLLNNQQTLSQWIRELQTGPLTVDNFVVGSPDARWLQPKASLRRRLEVSLYHFLMSFRKDYSQIGDVYRSDDKGAITVWVQRGQEWNELMKELIEEDFTPKTGIRVNVVTMPAAMAGDVVGVIKLATVGGTPPDAVFGVDPGLPVELAIRGAAHNLNEFESYERVRKRFRPGALIPYRWRGGDYALPETQDFQMLVYRRDILEQLGLGVPDTWEDVYQMIPFLSRYNMSFAGDPGYEIFLYKHGGSFYKADYLRSALDSPKALAALEEWTDLYTEYGVPVGANFYWHFRVGDMPVGVGSFYFYVQLATTAPELAGRWGIAPLPGYKLPDGSLSRAAGGATQTRVAMIFSGARKKKEAWQLLDWWTSDAVQERFAHEVEALIGAEARWNSANLQALLRLPWSPEEARVLEEQFRWIREVPVVLGGYMTGRQLSFAWTQVVLDGKKPRDAMESAVLEINKELVRKHEEFGLLPPGFKEELRERKTEAQGF